MRWLCPLFITLTACSEAGELFAPLPTTAPGPSFLVTLDAQEIVRGVSRIDPSGPTRVTPYEGGTIWILSVPIDALTDVHRFVDLERTDEIELRENVDASCPDGRFGPEQREFTGRLPAATEVFQLAEVSFERGINDALLDRLRITLPLLLEPCPIANPILEPYGEPHIDLGSSSQIKRVTELEPGLLLVQAVNAAHLVHETRGVLASVAAADLPGLSDAYAIELHRVPGAAGEPYRFLFRAATFGPLLNEGGLWELTLTSTGGFQLGAPVIENNSALRDVYFEPDGSLIVLEDWGAAHVSRPEGGFEVRRFERSPEWIVLRDSDNPERPHVMGAGEGRVYFGDLRRDPSDGLLAVQLMNGQAIVDSQITRLHETAQPGRFVAVSIQRGMQFVSEEAHGPFIYWLPFQARTCGARVNECGQVLPSGDFGSSSFTKGGRIFAPVKGCGGMLAIDPEKQCATLVAREDFDYDAAPALQALTGAGMGPDHVYASTADGRIYRLVHP